MPRVCLYFESYNLGESIEFELLEGEAIQSVETVSDGAVKVWISGDVISRAQRFEGRRH